MEIKNFLAGLSFSVPRGGFGNYWEKWRERRRFKMRLPSCRDKNSGRRNSKAGSVQPDSGEIKIGDSVKLCYVDQMRKTGPEKVGLAAAF